MESRDRKISPVPATGQSGAAAIEDGLPREIGPYRILQKIGEGGFGEVFVADQVEPVKRRVALKVLKAGMDTKAVLARFDAERQALALMDHPNIAKVLDAGQTEHGRPFFAMELVKGEPITEYCDRHTLSNRERLALFIPVCQAVQHAHQKGIIHRDLKPSNILVGVSDDTPTPKVIDFGIAKATGASLTERTLYTEQGQLIGTPEYMSPEQAEMSGLDVDTRTDVYALGIILYELLAGALPFSAETLRSAGYLEIRRIIREEEPPRPSDRVSTHGDGAEKVARRHRSNTRTLTKELREDLDWVVLKSIEKDRTRRYQTANALALEIQRYLNHEMVHAGPPSASYRLRKFARRNRIALAVVGAVAFGVLGSAAGLTYALLESNRQRAQMEVVLAEAQAARDESEAVTEFLSDMLAAVDPGEQGKDVTVREVMDAAAGSVGEKFEGRPRIEGRLRNTMGVTYRLLGDYESAEAQLESARSTREAALGSEDPATLDSMNELGVLLWELDRLDEAEELFTTVLDGRRRVLGEQDSGTLFTMNNLATLYYSQGRYDESAEMFAATLEGQIRVLGEEDPETLITMNNLGFIYKQEERYDEAEALFKRTLAIRERVLGQEHPSTIKSINNLGWFYYGRERYDEAEPHYQRNLALKRKVLGDEHPHTLTAIQNIGALRVKQERYTEAEPLLRDVVAGSRAVLPAGHRDLGVRLATYGRCLWGLEKFVESESAFLEARPLLVSSFGEEHERTVKATEHLAELYDSWGKTEQARRWRSRIVATDGGDE